MGQKCAANTQLPSHTRQRSGQNACAYGAAQAKSKIVTRIQSAADDKSDSLCLQRIQFCRLNCTLKRPVWRLAREATRGTGGIRLSPPAAGCSLHGGIL